MIRGVVVPMVTPVMPEGAIDTPSVERLVEHLIQGRVEGIFVLGTTGEALSVPPSERAVLVGATVEAAAGRVPVVAHPPFYYPLTDSELENWFVALADAVPLPLLLYNIPQTTHLNIPLAAIERLRHPPRVIGIKDSSPDEARIAALLAERGLCGPDMLLPLRRAT